MGDVFLLQNMCAREKRPPIAEVSPIAIVLVFVPLV